MPTVILLDASLSMLRPVQYGRRKSKDKKTRFKSTYDDPNQIDMSDTNEQSTDSDGNKVSQNSAYSNTSTQFMNLAKWGIDKLLSHFEQTYKLEQVAVLSYSSQCDLVAPFSRDIAEVRGKVYLSPPTK